MQECTVAPGRHGRLDSIALDVKVKYGKNTTYNEPKVLCLKHGIKLCKGSDVFPQGCFVCNCSQMKLHILSRSQAPHQQEVKSLPPSLD